MFCAISKDKKIICLKRYFRCEHTTPAIEINLFIGLYVRRNILTASSLSANRTLKHLFFGYIMRLIEIEEIVVQKKAVCKGNKHPWKKCSEERMALIDPYIQI